MSAPVPASSFDYAAIAKDHRSEVAAAAERIRLRMSRTAQDIIEIGRDLIAVKERLGHGKFLPWIETEFGMAERTARKFMAVAETFKSAPSADLRPSILYALAAPSTPDEVRDEVERRSQSGEKITADDVRRLKEEWASERKALGEQLAAAKNTARDARATQTDFGQQISSLRSEISSLQAERDSLQWQLRRAQEAQTAPATPASLIEQPDALDSVDSQVSALMADWNRVSDRARAEFLRRVRGALAHDKGAA